MTDNTLAGLHLRSIFCVSLVSTKRDIYGGALILSAFVGLVGSVFQLFLWKKHLKKHETRHRPSSNPHVVFHLALASAIASLMSLIPGTALFLIKPALKKGTIASYISSQDIYWMFPIQVCGDFGYIAAALWTFIYLIDVCLQVHKIECHVRVYHWLGWGLATFFTVLVQVFRFSDIESIRQCVPATDIPCIVIIWISLPVTLLALSSGVLYFIDKRVKSDICLLSNAYSCHQRSLMQRVRRKFFFFLLIFITCWISTLTGGIFVLANCGKTIQEVLSYTEAILHPLQGAFNYFMFAPLRSVQNVTASYHSNRKSPLLTRGTIQQIYGTSYESSLENSFVQQRSVPIVSSFHFTPCYLDDSSPLLTSYRGSNNALEYSFDDTLHVGKLLGEGD